MCVFVPSLRLRLTLLGATDAWSLTSERVLPRGRKTRALLAILALANGQPVSRLRLASLLWSRSAVEQARGSLRQALHELASALAPAGPGLLSAGRDAVTLDASQAWVDALEGLRATPDRPEALELLGAPLLPDLDGLSPALDSWLADERSRLQAQARALAGRILQAGPPAAQAAAAACLRRLEPALAVVPGGVPQGPPSRPAAPRRGIRLGVPPLAVSGGTEDAHLAAALAEEITAGLARFRWLFLADPATLAASPDPVAMAGRMGLDAVLLGSVQRDGARVRVALRLVEPESGDLPAGAAGPMQRAVLWSARFDREGEDRFTLQDEIAAAVVARLDPELLLMEGRRALSRPPADASAHDLLLRAIPALHALERNAFEEAGRSLEEAIRRDPDYAAAHAWAACWHILQVGQGWAPDHEAALARAEALAARATALDPADALALTVRGHVLAYLHHRPEEGCALHERALALNPNLAMAWVFSGLAHSYCGRHEAALDRLARYARLAPLHPLAFFFDAAQLVPLMLLGRHEAVIEAARAVVALHPAFSFPLRPWLASLGWLDRPEAAEVRTRLLALEPGLTIRAALRRAPLREADRALYAEGLRRGGLPEG
ncbi:hypothetical protein LPC08_04215 [Roseomonas sp. OT10]|uniref:hypothetical protein n=1 Tax=Roseomonas cutis TaxID=2897332 RepID=UPI001E594415|nr:hypothetical protein [Roseomonas sp. OT10]UFN49855.1 hypothetical protein LPC08_04215 [Roseomonas sp. OT10]